MLNRIVIISLLVGFYCVVPLIIGIWFYRTARSTQRKGWFWVVVGIVTYLISLVLWFGFTVSMFSGTLPQPG